MGLCLVKLLDHDGSVRVRVAGWIVCDDDALAIAQTTQMDVLKIGISYDVLLG